MAHGDRLFVDTNVWKHLTYAKATLHYQQQKAGAYSQFIGSCLKAGAVLYASVLSFTELASIIERTEWEIYKRASGTDVPLKKFREGVAERENVVQEVEAAWQQVEQMSTVLPINLDQAVLAAARGSFGGLPLDGYDVFFIEQMKASGIVKIVTDDLDFIYAPGLEVYTCNGDSIGRARLHKRLN